jgi:hypothetical protein
MLGRGWVHGKKILKMIGITAIMVKREIQCDRSQIRLLGRGLGPQKKKKCLKMIGTTRIKEKI